MGTVFTSKKICENIFIFAENHAIFLNEKNSLTFSMKCCFFPYGGIHIPACESCVRFMLYLVLNV